MKKYIRIVIILVIFLFILTGCGKRVSNQKGSIESMIKIGEEYVTVNVVRWKISEDRIKILTTTGEIYDVMYKDVAFITKDF